MSQFCSVQESYYHQLERDAEALSKRNEPYVEELDCFEAALREAAALIAERTKHLKPTIETTQPENGERILESRHVVWTSFFGDGKTTYHTVFLDEKRIHEALRECFDEQLAEIRRNIEE